MSPFMTKILWVFFLSFNFHSIHLMWNHPAAYWDLFPCHTQTQPLDYAKSSYHNSNLLFSLLLIRFPYVNFEWEHYAKIFNHFVCFAFCANLSRGKWGHSRRWVMALRNCTRGHYVEGQHWIWPWLDGFPLSKSTGGSFSVCGGQFNQQTTCVIRSECEWILANKIIEMACVRARSRTLCPAQNVCF